MALPYECNKTAGYKYQYYFKNQVHFHMPATNKNNQKEIICISIKNQVPRDRSKNIYMEKYKTLLRNFKENPDK